MGALTWTSLRSFWVFDLDLSWVLGGFLDLDLTNRKFVSDFFLIGCLFVEVLTQTYLRFLEC